MKNDTRNDVFTRNSRTVLLGRVFLCTLPCLVINQVWADVPPPPPSYHKPIDTSFPSGRALERQGYDPKTGVWKVNVNKTGKPTVTSNGSTVTGSQNVRITATDGYGNKATIRGKVTQTVSNTATAMIAGNIIGNSISKASSQFGAELDKNIANGDYYGAVFNTARIVGGAVDNAFTGGFLGDSFGATGTSKAKRTADSIINNFYRIPPSSKPTPPSSPSVNGSSASSQSSALSSAANAAASAQSAAEKSGDIGGALGAAAVGKAANAAAAAANAAASSQAAANAAMSSGAKLAEASRNKDGSYSQLFLRTIHARVEYGHAEVVVGYQIDKNNGIYNWEYIRNTAKPSWLKVSVDANKYSSVAGYQFKPITSDKELAEAQALVAGASATPSAPSVKPSDMTLSGDDIKDVLDRMFSSQQTNHAAMMSALSQIAANTAPTSPSSADEQSGSQSSGKPDAPRSQVVRSGPSIVDKATTSYTVSGDSAISAPYTPAGSDTPQQTRFDVNADGTVTATTVPRPDLKPHSSQAPTRHSVAPSAPNTQGSTQDTPSVPNQNHGTQANTNQSHQSQQSGQNQQQQERQDFCRQNPQSPACVDMGDASYEDLEIPEETIDLKFEPADIFQTDGVCPAPKVVDLGMFGSVEFSYEMLCDFARKIRPIFIAMTVLMCAYFVYESVREV